MYLICESVELSLSSFFSTKMNAKFCVASCSVQLQLDSLKDELATVLINEVRSAREQYAQMDLQLRARTIENQLLRQNLPADRVGQVAAMQARMDAQSTSASASVAHAQSAPPSHRQSPTHQHVGDSSGAAMQGVQPMSVMQLLSRLPADLGQYSQSAGGGPQLGAPMGGQLGPMGAQVGAAMGGQLGPMGGQLGPLNGPFPYTAAGTYVPVTYQTPTSVSPAYFSQLHAALQGQAGSGSGPGPSPIHQMGQYQGVQQGLQMTGPHAQAQFMVQPGASFGQQSMPQQMMASQQMGYPQMRPAGGQQAFAPQFPGPTSLQQVQPVQQVQRVQNPLSPQHQVTARIRYDSFHDN